MHHHQNDDNVIAFARRSCSIDPSQGSGSNVINTMMSSSLHSSSSAGGLYALHQSKGDASKGCDKNGYLKKRSEQMFRGKWQKRRCRVDRGCLEIFHR